MHKKISTIREDAQQKALVSPQKDPTLKIKQSQKMRADKLSDKRVDSATPKNNDAVFSAKPEPMRGPGDDRRPSSPKPHRSRPMMGEAASTNKHIYVPHKDFNVWKTHAEKAGYRVSQVKHVDQNEVTHVAMKHERDDKEHPSGPPFQRVRGYFWQGTKDIPQSNGFLRTKYIPENSVMSIGSGAVAGIQDPTTNYAFQVQKKKFQKIAKDGIERRKKPVAEEFANGIGNTQTLSDTKKAPKVRLAAIKDKAIKKKSATPPPTSSNNVDVAPPTGGVAA